MISLIYLFCKTRIKTWVEGCWGFFFGGGGPGGRKGPGGWGGGEGYRDGGCFSFIFYHDPLIGLLLWHPTRSQHLPKIENEPFNINTTSSVKSFPLLCSSWLHGSTISRFNVLFTVMPEFGTRLSQATFVTNVVWQLVSLFLPLSIPWYDWDKREKKGLVRQRDANLPNTDESCWWRMEGGLQWEREMLKSVLIWQFFCVPQLYLWGEIFTSVTIF